MPKTDPVTYLPMEYSIVHFGSPIGMKFHVPAPTDLVVEETTESEGDK